ncbi:MAG: hypothetical protein WKG01_24420 [Kofleriaceae bacterium]
MTRALLLATAAAALLGAHQLVDTSDEIQPLPVPLAGKCALVDLEVRILLPDGGRPAAVWALRRRSWLDDTAPWIPKNDSTVAELDSISVLVNKPMMVTTQRHQIGQFGLATVRPVLDVVAPRSSRLLHPGNRQRDLAAAAPA